MAQETQRRPDRISWVLLTTHAIDKRSQVEAVVAGYALRWRIEDFHRAWKRGHCNVESSQLHSRSALVKWATILATVAAGKHSKLDKRRYYVTARGSATESAALLDVCQQVKLLDEAGHRTAKRCQTPLLAQRSKRLNTVLQGPKSLGRSRHGAPVRLHHSTASTKLRSSRPGRPARFLPPSAALTFCHCRSSNSRRTRVDDSWSTPSTQWKACCSLCPQKRRLARAPSWARRARAKPAPQTSAYQSNEPNDSSRTVGHGHGHVYGHARAIPIQGHSLAR